MPHRRRVLALLILSVVVGAAAVGEEVVKQPSAEAAPSADNPLLRAQLKALFDGMESQSRLTINPDGSGSVRASTVEVLVAKIGPDGKVITACVNSAAGAERFLAPRTKQHTLDAAGEPKEK